MKNITFLYTHPIQYFTPLHKQISEIENINQSVIYCENTTNGYYDKEFNIKVSWDINLLEGYKYFFLNKKNIYKYFFNCNFNIAKKLRKLKTEILIIHGWNYSTAIFSILYAKLNGIKVWIRAENPYCQEVEKTYFIRFFKKILLQFFLFKIVDKFLYIGHQNKLFYKSLGVDDKNLIFTPYCVNNKMFEFFQQNNNLAKDVIRESLGLKKDDFVILFSGKLIEKKNPLDLLKAFNISNLKNAKLLFLGNGILLNELTEFTKNNKIDNVIFLGFKNQKEISQFYSISDLFVLPSGMGETWGLVVNEAMNFSLPIIVSNLVGCKDDLIKNNGLIFREGDIIELSICINKFANDRDFRLNSGQNSKLIINNYNYNIIINNILKSI